MKRWRLWAAGDSHETSGSTIIAPRLVVVLAELSDRCVRRVFLALPGPFGPLLQGRALQVPVGSAGAACQILLALAAFGVDGAVIANGKRSCMVLGALGAAVLIGWFWLVFALGEVIWPH